MGLLSALLVLPLTFIISEKVNAKILSGTLLILVAGLFVTNKFFPEPFDRMKMAANVMFSKKAIDKSDVESTAVRILIWEESMKITKENFLFGTTRQTAPMHPPEHNSFYNYYRKKLEDVKSEHQVPLIKQII